MTEWKPINTAPKAARGTGPYDGSCGPVILLTEGSSVYIGFWNGRTWDDGDFFDDLGKMTHWQPLPNLPTTAQDGQTDAA